MSRASGRPATLLARSSAHAALAALMASGCPRPLGRLPATWWPWRRPRSPAAQAAPPPASAGRAHRCESFHS
eukprot:15479361-Alexandrium_andersonii.AAC.1